MVKKEPPKKAFSLQGFDVQAYKQSEAYVQSIDALYSKAIQDFAQLAGRTNVDPSKLFRFSDYPTANIEAQKIIKHLSEQINGVIVTGSRKQWLYACQKNDEFLNHILDTSKVPAKRLAKMQDKNLDALNAFQSRKVQGLGLSQRVWRYSGQMKDTMELGIDIALGDGKSAARMARDLKQYLVDPDKLFRRVRDKHGNLVLSKNAKAFHPGQGVYRSSVKNAQRLTRSEINMAYKESDIMRWQQLDFVIGYEVKVSERHKWWVIQWKKANKGKTEICDRLDGKYPKEFVFKGWHTQCMCHLIPILMDEDDFDTDELNELRAAVKGTEYKPFSSPNAVADVPEGFKTWVAENKKASDRWKSQPYFVRDNFKDGRLSGGLKLSTTEAKKSELVGGTEKVKHIPQVKAKDVLSEVIGVKRGNEMTFEEANELRGNIDFSQGGAYRINCQSCVVSNELRRRGYDVTAMPNLKTANNIPYKLSMRTEMAWIDPATGEIPKKMVAGGRAEFVNSYSLRMKPKSIAKISKDLDDFTKEVGRYHIDFVWKGRRSGHIITLERLENGLIRIYDPQSGKIVSWVELSRQISTQYGVNVLRVDKLDVNLEIIAGVVRKL